MIFLTQALMVLLLWSPLQLAFAGKGPNKDLSDKFICLVNRVRETLKLPPFGTCESLLQAAQDQANYQAKIGEMQHEGPGGNNVGDRASSHGYKWNWIGENVAFGYDLDEITCLKMWLNSPPHRANILSDKFEMSALAKASGEKNSDIVYYAMTFGTNADGNRDAPDCGKGKIFRRDLQRLLA